MSSFLKKASLALNTLKDVTKSAIEEGAITLSEEDKQKRLVICESCEYYTTLLGKPKCNECGCFMNLKTALAKAKCPVDKW